MVGLTTDWEDVRDEQEHFCIVLVTKCKAKLLRRHLEHLNLNLSMN